MSIKNISMKYLSAIITLAIISVSPSAKATATSLGDHYVVTDETKERLAPGESAKDTNTLFKRQKVTVLELKGGWARVSKYYDGSVEGQSGTVARWVKASDLSVQRPPEEKVDGPDKQLLVALKNSDNFERHKGSFTAVSKRLIAERVCTLKDFSSAGGWMKSTQYTSGTVYFVYCGGMRKENKVYMDANTQKSFR